MATFKTQSKAQSIGYAVFASAKFTIFEALAMCVTLELFVHLHWLALTLWACGAAFVSKYVGDYFTR